MYKIEKRNFMIKFLHIADLHLDAQFSSFDTNVSKQRRLDQKRDFTNAINLAIEKNVDFVVIPGDIFDCDYPSSGDINFVNNEFLRLYEANIKTIVLPGTHDSIFPDSIWNQNLFPTIDLLKDTETQVLEFPEYDIEFHGIAFSKDQTSKRKLKDLETNIKSKYSMLLFHGSLENFGQELKNDYPFNEKEINKLPYTYIALGHYHKMQKVGDKAYYTGSMSPVRFKNSECGQRYGVYGEISENKTFFEPIELDTTQYLIKEHDLSMESLDVILKALSNIKDPNKVYLKIVLNGLNEDITDKKLKKFKNSLLEKFKHIIIENKLDKLPEISEDDLFLHLFRDKIDARIKNSPEKKQLLTEAFKIGLMSFKE